MSTYDFPPPEFDLAKVIALCDRLAASRKLGNPLRVEDLLAEGGDIPRDALLRELLVVDIETRRMRGEVPEPAEYIERFPDDADLVHTAFREAASIIEPRPDSPGSGVAPHLLFAAVAFHHRFIGRNDLLAALRERRGDPSKTPARILLERGAIDDTQRELIDNLAAKLSDRNGGDLWKCLAELTSIGSLRDEFARLDDPDLADFTTVADTVSFDGSKRPESGTRGGGRYRILREHAEGGRGCGYEAVVEELGRIVALKEIKHELAGHPELRSRFTLEAEISGGLQHPGIVPVYSLGAYDDGEPYYAMRFVDGSSLKDAVAEHHGRHPKPDPSTKEFRDLLNRFVDICNAIAFAHSRGVLHRDLKPHNVMIGKYGESLIIDWGLARATGKSVPSSNDGREEPPLSPSSGSGVEATKGVIGTPNYMSPEQAAGPPDRLGPATDVYGLGAILYHLLTGQAPFLGLEADEVLPRVIAGEITPPRALNPRVPVTLEAVCLKALALESGDRYPGAKALADDVESWLADEPVSARRDPFLTRAARWTRKHRVAVAVAAATLVVGLTASLYGLQRERLFAKDLKLQRDRAQNREEQAIAAVKRFGDAVSKNWELKNNPALEPLRKELLQDPLAFFRSLRELLQADGDTRPEYLARLAEVMHDYAHLADEVGDNQDGLRSHEESLAIWKKLTGEHPGKQEYQTGLATIYTCQGNMLSEIGETDAAWRSYVAALTIRQKVANDQPAIAEDRSDLAVSHDRLGLLLNDLGQSDAAREHLETALSIRQKLADEHPEFTENQSYLADCHTSLGVIQRDLGQTDAARNSIRSALAIQQKLALDHPLDTRYQNDLAFSHLNLGNLLRSLREADAARGSYESALAIWQKLAHDHPAILKYQSHLANTLDNLGIILSDLDRAEAARRSFESALAIQQKLADDHPNVTGYQSGLADSHECLAVLLHGIGPPKAVRKCYESALAIRERLSRDHPESPDFVSDLGGLLHNLAMLDINEGRIEEGRSRLRQAITCQKKALKVSPNNPKYHNNLMHHLTELLSVARRWDRDEEAAEARLELRKLRASEPGFASLTASLKGPPPKSNAERLQLAQAAYDASLHVASAGLWDAALQAEPKIAEDRQTQPRYNAARAAALAGTGVSIDEPPPDNDGKAKLRAQALGWLRAELTAWNHVSLSMEPGNKETVATILKKWKKDTDLIGVREEKALVTLPESERRDWEELWGEVDALLNQMNKAL